MIIPALVAFVERDYFVARTFLYSSGAGVIFYTLIAIALSNAMKIQNNFEKLLSFILSYLFLPIFMALPLVLSIAEVRLLDAWLEMVSSFTTTGFKITNLETLNTAVFSLPIPSKVILFSITSCFPSTWPLLKSNVSTLKSNLVKAPSFKLGVGILPYL